MIKKVIVTLSLVASVVAVPSPASAGISRAAYDTTKNYNWQCGADGSPRVAVYLPTLLDLVSGAYGHSRGDMTTCHTVKTVLGASAYQNPGQRWAECYIKSTVGDNGDLYWAKTYIADGADRRLMVYINDRYFRQFIPNNLSYCGSI